MNIRINFYESFRCITKRDYDILDVSDNKILKEFIIKDLIDEYGSSFRKLVLDKKGDIQRYLLVIVNGNVIKNMRAKLSDNDEITLLLPVAGG